MKIYMYIVEEANFTEKLEEYSKLANQIFDCDENELENKIENAYLLKNEITAELKSLTPAKVFDEEFYDEQIGDEEIKMLLSNGLYSKEQLLGMMEKCSPSFQDAISDGTKECAKNHMILFWNC